MTLSGRSGVLLTAVFAAVLSWQAGGFALETAHERWPGSAYAPRVDALLGVCLNAANDGPFAVVRAGPGRYSLATTVIGDAGHAALVDVVCRARHRPIGRRGLGWIALAIFTLCPVLAYAASGRNLRVALIVTLLVRELSIAAYRNVDTVSLFGPLVLLVLAIALLANGGRGAISAVAGGLLWTALYAERSVFAYFAFLVAMGMAMVPGIPVARRYKDLLAFILTSAVSLALWNHVVGLRLEAPGLAEKEAITAHNTWGYLVTGIGFSPNPWGIRASDPAVVEFLARFAAGPPLTMEHPENEARAKRFMVQVVSREPWALATVYLDRLPSVLSEFFSLGLFGVLLVAGLFPLAWRAAPGTERQGLLAVFLLCLCLVAQAVILDPRPLFSNPLLVASTLLQFSLAHTIVSSAWARRSGGTSPGP